MSEWPPVLRKPVLCEERARVFVYSMYAPIDVWDGWMPEDQYVEQVIKSDGWPTDLWPMRLRVEALQRYIAYRNAVFTFTKAKTSWDGDIREGPFISSLPAPVYADDFDYLLAWKQENNGDTFVASPHRLAWLEGQDLPNEVESGTIEIRFTRAPG